MAKEFPMLRDLRVISTPDNRDILAWRCSHCDWQFDVGVLSDETSRRVIVRRFREHCCANFPAKPGPLTALAQRA